jgi:ligand-binding sensor domain-containing protein
VAPLRSIGGSSPTFFTQSWQTEEGLPDNAVNDVAQTPDGYLWLATLKGLVRFDGLHFRVFTPPTAPGLRSAQVRRLMTATDGTLWIAAGSGGMTAMREGRFQSYAYPPDFASDIGDALGEARDGSVWNATRTAPLLRMAAGKVVAFSREGTEISHWNQWINREDGGLDLLSGRSIYGLRDGVFARLVEFRGGSVCTTRRTAGGHWFATDRSLFVSQDHLPGNIVAALPASAPVRAMLEDRRGALWLGTEGAGLFRFADGSFTSVPTSHPSIRALFEDREGNLWAGTAGGGINKIRNGNSKCAIDRVVCLPKWCTRSAKMEPV